eukprot:c35278_g1_i1 orf=102-320(-)
MLDMVNPVRNQKHYSSSCMFGLHFLSLFCPFSVPFLNCSLFGLHCEKLHITYTSNHCTIAYRHEATIPQNPI